MRCFIFSYLFFRCRGQSAGKFRTNAARTSRSTSHGKNAKNSRKQFAPRYRATLLTRHPEYPMSNYQDPVNVAKKIPKKTCVQIPREVCNKIPRQIIKEVPKKVGKKVCTSTKASTSYGEETASYQAPPSYTAPSDDYGAPISSGYGAPVSSGYGAPSHSAHRRSSQIRSSPLRKQAELPPADNWGMGPG